MNRAIQNFETLAKNTLRLEALSLAEAGYGAINTGAALVREVRLAGDTLTVGDTEYSLDTRRVFFIGIGKCAIAAAGAIEKIFGERLTGGIAFDVSLVEGISLKKIETFIGTHPLPSEANEHATERIINLLSQCEENDLVIILISGGGSTLLCRPPSPMLCTDESALWSELTAHGASIQDINTVRKHLSSARGGGLAKAAYPAEVLSLIISDVPGNDIEYIASGPTILDSSTIADAKAVLTKSGATPKMPIPFIETPKEQKYFDRVTNVLFLTNQDALKAMKEKAVQRGYSAIIMNDNVTGEARVVGRSILEELHSMPSKTVLLYAGETTVTLGNQHGTGGRNQEMALGVLEDIHDNELILPFASDGHDNSDRAGAIADAITRTHANEKNLSIDDYLARHCSYDFFATTGDALTTGYTESNVSDIIIAIKN